MDNKQRRESKTRYFTNLPLTVGATDQSTTLRPTFHTFNRLLHNRRRLAAAPEAGILTVIAGLNWFVTLDFRQDWALETFDKQEQTKLSGKTSFTLDRVGILITSSALYLCLCSTPKSNQPGRQW
jgi:hypothetical protein